MDIVFDLGNVLFEWNPLKLVESLFPDEGAQQEALHKVILHHDWHLLDKGAMTLEEAVSRADKRCTLGVRRIARLFDEIPKHLVPIKEMIDIPKELNQKGYRLYVLSNMQKHFYEYLAATHDIWHYFAGIVISSHVHMIKPEPEIYEHLIETYCLTPANTVFLDDIQINIEIAERFGMRTIHFNDPAKGKKELYQMLGI